MTTESDQNTGTLSQPLVNYTSGQYLPPIDPAVVEKALTVGDVGKMDAATRVQFYRALCLTTGVNPLTRPFILLKTQGGELVWYATVGCAEQLRKLHHVSTRIVSRESTEDGLHITTVLGRLPDGREEEAQGIVAIQGLKGQELSNALMRCESKAKRRVTLALCGLGLGLADDERAEYVPFNPQSGDVTLPPEAGEVSGSGSMVSGLNQEPGTRNQEPVPTLLTTVGQWFRTRPKDSREVLAQVIWGVTLHEMPHLSLDDLAAGWHRLDEGRAPLAWDSLTLAEDLAQWQQAHAREAILDVFDRSEGRPEEGA